MPIRGKRPNGWELGRRRVKQCAQQSKTRHTAKTGNKAMLDWAVGTSDLLCGANFLGVRYLCQFTRSLVFARIVSIHRCPNLSIRYQGGAGDSESSLPRL